MKGLAPTCGAHGVQCRYRACSPSQEVLLDGTGSALGTSPGLVIVGGEPPTQVSLLLKVGLFLESSPNMIEPLQ